MKLKIINILSVKTLIVYMLLAFSFSSYAQTEYRDMGQCLVGDIWIIVDESTSIKGKEQYVENAVGFLARNLIYSNSNTRVGLISFKEDTPNLEIDLTDQPEKFYNFKLNATGHYENIGNALWATFRHHQKTVSDQRKSEPDYNQVLILISDGIEVRTNYPARTQKIAQDIKNEGIDIISVLLTEDDHPRAEDAYMHMLNISGMHDEANTNALFSTNLDELTIFFQTRFGCP